MTDRALCSGDLQIAMARQSRAAHALFGGAAHRHGDLKIAATPSEVENEPLLATLMESAP